MRLLSGLAAGLFVYLVIGSVVGVSPRWLQQQNNGRRPGARWQDWLNQAGVSVTPFQFVAVSVSGAALVAALIFGLTGVASLAAVGGGITLMAPRSMYAKRRRALTRSRLASWPDALRDISSHLRSSLSVHGSLCELGRSGPEPLRPYFNRYAGLAVALDYKSALEVVREDLADPMSDRIIEILLLAFDQGSSVVIDVLDELADSSTLDLRLLEEVETSQLETRLEARGATVMPFVVLAILCATTSGYREFYASPAGWLVVSLGGVMAAGGLVVISRLGHVPSEERILAGGGS